MGRRADAQRPIIAVVDDDRDIRSALHSALSGRGYHVIEAQNGLRLVSALEVDRPALILLDVSMSWIDGFELCRALKSNPRFAEIPVVFVTGRSDSRAIEEGRRVGASDYFVKPLDMERLLSRVGELLLPGA